jgi:putative ATP-dependent endonuclease of OLD family
MFADSVKFRGHGCFKSEWAGFDTIRPVNVIIGRNNTGKSHLLDLASALCEPKLYQKGWQYLCRGTLDDRSLKSQFGDAIGNDLDGNHWNSHGKHLVGIELTWEGSEQSQVKNLTLPISFKTFSPEEQYHQARIRRLAQIVTHARHKLSGSVFRRLQADRDIRPEPEDNNLRLSQDGSGATNIIRRYMVSSSGSIRRELVHHDLLDALNQIFRGDGKFTEIEVKFHDEEKAEHQGHWEVFLGEEKKGLISLSKSGSGLKTVILVLLNLLVIPETEKKPRGKFVFAFEELENNLHPSLLRRLFQYIEAYVLREAATVFLTTHSSIALDLFGLSKNAQIVHVTHDGECARTQTVSAHFDRLGVISELGAKPSDLLQANGIVWVEGPSDFIYLNRWIELFSDGEFQAGRDYQCAFYGGSLLNRTQFTSPEKAEAELVNLFRVNPNIVVVCDGDRTVASGEGSQAKNRVLRIEAEVLSIPGAHIWITEGKEIENYLPGVVLDKVFEVAGILDPERHEVFFPSKNTNKEGASFVELQLKRRGVDKMELAIQAAPHMTKDLMEKRFDLADQMRQIIEKIRRWNA